MASTSYNAGDVLQLLEGDGSEFPDSISSGKEGDEVYPYSGPSISVPMNQNTAALTLKLDRNISDHGKLIF